MQSLPFLALNQQTGWLQGARHLASSNRNARPSAEVSLLVIHSAMAEALFTHQLPIDAPPYFGSAYKLNSMEKRHEFSNINAHYCA